MSQITKVVTAGNLPPSVPTSFVTNLGSAVPAANVLNILGTTSAAGAIPFEFTGSGNTVTGIIQLSQAIAATNAMNVGLSAFNSAQFTVDANGFVSLIGGGSAIETITGNTGGPEVPLAGNFNVLGTGSITVAGSANTETVQLTGLTNHAVLVGAGTTTITKIAATANTGAVLQNNAGADPSYSTATYPSTTTINQILYSSAANTITGLATGNDGVLITSNTGVPSFLANGTAGQILTANTAAPPSWTTPVGLVFTWTDVTSATQALSVSNGYFTDRGGGVTYTLPATAVLGDIIIIDGKLGITTIAQNAGQSIRFSSQITTVGVSGSAVGTNLGDDVTLRCSTAGASTVWFAENFNGNWTIS